MLPNECRCCFLSTESENEQLLQFYYIKVKKNNRFENKFKTI